jgi:predicted N-acetyltransferase YhbS
MVTIRAEIPADEALRERLLDRAFGKRRHAKTSARLRDGRKPAQGLAFTAVNKAGRVVGTVRLWNVIAGSAGPALLLGPLAVDCAYRGRGLGRELMHKALAAAFQAGHGAVLLVGDASYYARFGFKPELVTDLHLPGPVDRARFLGLELAPGALDGAEGLVAASGVLVDAEGKVLAA